MSINNLIHSHFKYIDSILNIQNLKQEELKLNESIETLLEICPSSRFPFVTVDHLSGIYPKEARASLVNSIFDLISKNRDLIFLNVSDTDLITRRSELIRYVSQVCDDESAAFFIEKFESFVDLRSTLLTTVDLPEYYLESFIAKGIIIKLSDDRIKVNMPPFVQRLKDLETSSEKLVRSIKARKAHAIHVRSPCELYPLVYKVESSSNFERKIDNENTEMAAVSMSAISAIISKKTKKTLVREFHQASVKDDNYFKDFPFHCEWLVYYVLGKSRHRIKLRRFKNYAEIGTF